MKPNLGSLKRVSIGIKGINKGQKINIPFL